jgi:hypothetical protein
VAPALNDLYCYFCQLGRWKELSPPEIDSRKRELDKNMHFYEALLTHGVIEAYDRFMRDAFQAFIMPGADGALQRGIGAKRLETNGRLSGTICLQRTDCLLMTSKRKRSASVCAAEISPSNLLMVSVESIVLYIRK